MKTGEISNIYITHKNIHKIRECRHAASEINFMAAPVRSDYQSITRAAVDTLIDISKREHKPVPDNILKAVSDEYTLLKLRYKFHVLFNKLSHLKEHNTVINGPIKTPYEDKYEELENIFISGIKSDLGANIPPCILLCGNRENYMNMYRHLLGKLKGFSDTYAMNIMNISADTVDDRFIDRVMSYLETAKAKYQKTGKRSLIVFHDAEKILAIPGNCANLMGINPDEKDKKILEETGYNMKRVSFFKSLLDSVSQLPEENFAGYSAASATTFLFTSENPHLLHPDLVSRKGKVHTIFIGIPEGDDIKNAILEKLNLRNKIKRDAFTKQEWDKITANLKPDTKTGGFSLGRISQLVMNYRNSDDYKKRSFVQNQIAVIKLLLNSPRDIQPDTCKRIKYVKSNII